MSPLLLSSLVLIQFFLVISACLLCFKEQDYSTPDAFCYSFAFSWGLYSSLIQWILIFNAGDLFFIVDIFLSSASLVIIFLKRKVLIKTCHNLAVCIKSFRFDFAIGFFVLFYLFLQVLLFPPTNIDSLNYNLTRILMMHKENSLFLKNFSCQHQVNFPVASDVMTYTLLRFESDWFLSYFSFLSYLTIAMGTFSLTMKVFNDHKLSAVSTLIIASLTNIVLQSTNTKNDLPTAAMGVASILFLYNYLKYRKHIDIAFVFTALSLGV